MHPHLKGSTRLMANTTAILTELHALEHLTRTEIAVAKARMPQARTAAIRRELAENATAASHRARDIAAALRDQGTLSNVLAPALGWTATLLRAAVEQTQPLAEALLSDLMLEHQLAERARHLVALTDDGPEAVHQLAERLLAAHNETIEWLRTVLAEQALDGAAALRPTPFQAVASGVTRIVVLPARLTAASLNRVACQTNRAGRGARQQVERVGELAGEARRAATAGAKAATDHVETIAREAANTAADTAADTMQETRKRAGVVKPDELPIADYDHLNARDAAAAVRELDDATALAAVERYEARHKNRSGVRNAVQDRTSSVARAAAEPN